MSIQTVAGLIHAAGRPPLIVVEHYVYEAMMREIIQHSGGAPPLVSEVRVMDTLVLSVAGKFRPTDFN